MGFLSRFFGGNNSQNLDGCTENKNVSTTKDQESLWDIGLKILTATTKCYDQVLPHMSVTEETARRESEGGIFLEFIFFFLYFVLRTTSAKGWKVSETGKLEAFLVPKIAWVAIDQLFTHVDSERRKAIMDYIYKQWGIRRNRYNSSNLFYREHQLDGTYVFTDLAMLISGLCGQMLNDGLTQAIANLVVQESKHMEIESVLDSARVVICENQEDRV
jgi:hypothetical protein